MWLKPGSASISQISGMALNGRVTTLQTAILSSQPARRKRRCCTSRGKRSGGHTLCGWRRSWNNRLSGSCQSVRPVCWTQCCSETAPACSKLIPEACANRDSAIWRRFRGCMLDFSRYSFISFLEENSVPSFRFPQWYALFSWLAQALPWSAPL